MVSDIKILDNVKIASPCHVSWELMDSVEGDRVKHCRFCELNVYNLSDMSRSQAEELLRKHEGRLCVRFYQRADGTMLTDNCPVGLRRARRALIAGFAKVATACALFLRFGYGWLGLETQRKSDGVFEPVVETRPSEILGGVTPMNLKDMSRTLPADVPQPKAVMGALAPPTRTTGTQQ